MASNIYQAAVRGAWSVPAKFGYFLAGWGYLMTWQNVPQPGMREISMEEWNATPAEYLLHSDLHPKLFSRVPGESAVGNERAALFKKHGRQDHDPSHPAEGHGHH